MLIQSPLAGLLILGLLALGEDGIRGRGATRQTGVPGPIASDEAKAVLRPPDAPEDRFGVRDGLADASAGPGNHERSAAQVRHTTIANSPSRVPGEMVTP